MWLSIDKTACLMFLHGEQGNQLILKSSRYFHAPSVNRKCNLFRLKKHQHFSSYTVQNTIYVINMKIYNEVSNLILNQNLG